MNTFTVNGAEYKVKELDFGGVCDLEDMGVSVTNISEKSVSTARAYFAFCANISKEKANEELNAHLKNGGNIKELMELAIDAIGKSDFFQSFKEAAETENTENQAAETEEKQ